MNALARARQALGTKFRLHGRDPASGLDCVGLAAWAHRVDAPRGYALRTADAARAAAAIEAAGLRPSEEMRAGDVLLLRSGPGQLHFAIWTGAGVIHADAMLRRVVERPGLPWPVLGQWRR